MDKTKPQHRYLFTYTANMLDGRGMFTGQATMTLSAPFAPANLGDVCKTIQSSCPERIASPTVISVWKFES